MLSPGRTGPGAQHHPAVRDYRRPPARSAIMDGCFPCRSTAPCCAAKDEQEVMLGYSDSQQGRRLPRRPGWELYKAEIELERGLRPPSGPPASVPRPRRVASDAAAVPATRRSGPARRRRSRARSGSPSRARSSPQNIGDPEVGRRNLEVLVAATLEAALIDLENKVEPAEAFHLVMGQLSGAGLSGVSPPGLRNAGLSRLFPPASTPIAKIFNLNIGSRPASRTKSNRIEDLRAIPWVFSWAQCRLMLPGWYGFGSAVEAHGRRRPGRNACCADSGLGRSSARCCPTWTRCWPSRPRHRVALCQAGRRRRSEGRHLRPHHRRNGR